MPGIDGVRKYSKDIVFHILKEVAISPGLHPADGKIIGWMQNLFGTYGIFLISNENEEF